MNPSRILIALGTATLGFSSLRSVAQIEVEWITSSHSMLPGTGLQTAIRITHKPGWHTYWLNPGESGIPTTVDFQLPEGWKLESLHYPAPVRFTNGELLGFGYEDTVLIPVNISASSDFKSPVTLSAEVTWLACNEDSCVPGEMPISLTIQPDAPAPTPEAHSIEVAQMKIPRSSEHPTKLEVLDEGDSLVLKLKPDPRSSIDWSAYQVFPKSADILDPKAILKFTPANDSSGIWIARGPVSTYASRPLTALSLLLTHPTAPPIELEGSIP
ncbi:MAG: protein-disulfide reductase DsbD domain-containing protein, partial [Luteolibacter sp.]